MIARNRSVFATSMRAASMILGRHSGQLGREGEIYVHHIAGLSTTALFIHHLPRCSSCNG
jgi:hypothetical protein